VQNRRKQLNELTYEIRDAEEECLFGTQHSKGSSKATDTAITATTVEKKSHKSD
jgi:hypothetical protein